MINFALIFVSLFTGLWVKKYKRLPQNSHRVINLWIIYIALPAITLRYIPKMSWNTDLLLPILMPLIVFSIAFVGIKIVSKFKVLDQKTKACLLLTVGLSNVSFLGFPIVTAYYGQSGLELAILCDQASFLIVSTLGILTATHASEINNEKKNNWTSLFKKIFSFPPTIAFISAFILPEFISFDMFDPLLDSLGATMVPMALFSVGLQLQFTNWNVDKMLLISALSYKLILAPLFIVIISSFFIIEKLYVQVSVLEASMAPMVTGTIIASEFNLKPKLSILILSFGIPLSFITTYFWFLFLV